MKTLSNETIAFSLFVLFSIFTPDVAYCDDVWTQSQLIEKLNKGTIREIALVPGGMKGKYFDSYGRLEVFMVPEKTPDEYSSFSPEIISLIQKHGVSASCPAT